MRKTRLKTVGRGNITAGLSSDVRLSTTTIDANGLSGEGGAVGFFMHKDNARVFEPGERVYVTKFNVKDDKVEVDIRSVKMFDVLEKGTTKQTRYRALLEFTFPKEQLAQEGFPVVQNAIASVLVSTHSPEHVKRALIQNELKPFFQQTGWMSQGSAASGIRWNPNSDGSLSGKTSYFRNKHLCIFRFRADLAPHNGGCQATISAHNGPFSPWLRLLTYAVGLLMCCVGVVIPILMDRGVERGLRKIAESLEHHLKMWDRATN